MRQGEGHKIVFSPNQRGFLACTAISSIIKVMLIDNALGPYRSDIL